MGKAITLVEANINSPNLQEILTDLDNNKEIKVVNSKNFTQPSKSIWQMGKGKPQPESLTQTKDFTLADGSAISLTFHAMVTPVSATVSTLQLQLYIITGIMCLLATVMAMIISKRISRPIETLNVGAKALAMGNYNTHFAGRGFLEIKELSDNLNTAADELSKVEGLRRELMANISHDLRTPLALIYSYAEMMHDFPGEITADQTQMIMDETRRLTSLVNDVLDVSRLETGTMELNKGEFNLTEALEKTVNRMSELVKKDGYSLDFTHEGQVYVLADEVKIMQAFYNLLINAINYSGEEKSIVIRQRIKNRLVRIEIEDRGEGIAAGNLPHIWDRYYKINKKHKRAVTGTGLGLSIVKKIISLHGGSYGVTSEVGVGSVFWFELAAVQP